MPLVTLQEPVPVTPGSNKGNRNKAATTPFVRLREPAPLTPAMQRAHHRHAEVRCCGLRAACPAQLGHQSSCRSSAALLPQKKMDIVSLRSLHLALAASEECIFQ